MNTVSSLAEAKPSESGEKLFLEAMLAESEKVQQSAMEVDERSVCGRVSESLTAADWDSMDLYRDETTLQGSAFGQPDHKGTVVRTEVSNRKIGVSALVKTAGTETFDSYALQHRK